MTRSLAIAAVTTALAIAVTSAMDARGLTAFSALPLFPLALLLRYANGRSWRGAGLRLGSRRDYAWATGYPIVVIGLCTVIALGADATVLSRVDWWKAVGNVALVASATVGVALITEEGFFRGALWGALHDAGLRHAGVLAWTSFAFALWHVSAVTLPTGFDLPRAQVPLFLVNAALMGAIWGALRLLSGSIVVSSVSHGLWNGLGYALFGYGTKIGALGVTRTDVFGPEVGVIGLTLNLLALTALLARARRHFSDGAPTAPVQVVIAP